MRIFSDEELAYWCVEIPAASLGDVHCIGKCALMTLLICISLRKRVVSDRRLPGGSRQLNYHLQFVMCWRRRLTRLLAGILSPTLVWGPSQSQSATLPYSYATQSHSTNTYCTHTYKNTHVEICVICICAICGYNETIRNNASKCK